jgi:hypothetical protein
MALVFNARDFARRTLFGEWSKGRLVYDMHDIVGVTEEKFLFTTGRRGQTRPASAPEPSQRSRSLEVLRMLAPHQSHDSGAEIGLAALRRPAGDPVIAR